MRTATHFTQPIALVPLRGALLALSWLALTRKHADWRATEAEAGEALQ